jgi:hypothetical protein
MIDSHLKIKMGIWKRNREQESILKHGGKVMNDDSLTDIYPLLIFIFNY